ncbi:hypothetical protein K438DRAFT_1756968 [Mycena galopus ATCC 62051]|nr:hypothetical protein K438DRAFT_1756968 [Mycena galopus ATCC 62051]
MESTFNPNPTIGQDSFSTFYHLHRAYQIGVLVSYLLFGITTTQAYMYYSRFPEDSTLRLKSLISQKELAQNLLLSLRYPSLSTSFICCCWYTDQYLMYARETEDKLESAVQKMPVSAGITIFLTGFIATPGTYTFYMLHGAHMGGTVQWFFAHRIYTLSGKLFIPCILWALSFLGLLGAISISGGAVHAATLVSFEAEFAWVAIATWSLSVATDLGITVTLSFPRTTAVVDQLIKWTLETGMLTSLFNIANAFQVMPENCLVCIVIWIALFIVMARLFANSFLASLNSRTTLRAMNDTSISLSLPVLDSHHTDMVPEPTLEMQGDLSATNAVSDI